jgi:hypothetical protein
MRLKTGTRRRIDLPEPSRAEVFPVWRALEQDAQEVPVSASTERLDDRPSPPDPLLLAQGIYFLATGLWPLLDRQSFERVTGAKRDFWLAQTVGVLVTCIGGTLVLAERLDRVSRELRLLAGASAGGLAAVDLVFALRGRISKVYLVDAAIETPFLAQLAALRPDRSRGPATEAPPKG